MKFRILGAALALCVVGAAHAQASLPRPAEFYFDADANTVRLVVAVREANADAAIARLDKAIQRNPRAVAERAQLARIAMDGGREALGRELYAAALAQIATTHGLWRSIMWNYGWDLYRAGAYDDALAQWQALIGARGTTASWIPPTLAIVLWQLGRRDEAVQWYAAAVRTEPAQWSTTAQYATLLPAWRDAERETLAQVHEAWARSATR
ncbi:MAG TPA: tetratricopeptide repeat protein [Lysobacter sp.]